VGTMTATAPIRKLAPGRPPLRVRLPVWLPRAFDLVTLALLGMGAYVARRGSLPSDGLWFDDSWVAAGAILGSPRQLLAVGSGHPGFTAILMAVDRIGGGDLTHLGVPSLVFGVLAPPALYVALRSFGYARAISAIVSAALVVAPIPILYSGRVKGYTLDTLVVLLLAVAVPVLARRTWRWPVAVAWTVAAIGITSLSAYTLLATAGAGVILVLHPCADRRVRIMAVGVQAVVQGAYLTVAQSKSDLAGIEEVMGRVFDGHMTFSWNPLTFGAEVLEHLRRLAEVYPGSPGEDRWWLAALALLSMAGVVIAAVRGRQRTETLAARYLLLLVLLAAGGSLVDRFPFGPTNEVPLSAGGRHMLWMLPAFALGLAALAQRAQAFIADRDPLRRGVDALVVTAAIAIVLVAYEPAREAPFPGSASAARFVDASLGPTDVLIVTNSSTFSFAISTTTPVGVQATPDHQVGFAPVYLDRRIRNIGGWAVEPGSPAQIRAWTADADRVFVVAGGAVGSRAREDMRVALESQGFTSAETVRFVWNTVDVYRA
jgi:hypothetical protein